MDIAQIKSKSPAFVETHVPANAEGAAGPGTVHLKLHGSMVGPVLFLCRALRPSGAAKVISITSGLDSRVDMLVDLTTRARAASFLAYVGQALDALDPILLPEHVAGHKPDAQANVQN